MLTRPVIDPSSSGRLEYLSIVIPVFNQEKQISKVLGRMRSILDQTFSNYEIVIVDDGSTDGTHQVLREEIQHHSNTRVISYKPNRGKGFAVKTGVLETKGSIVLFTDGDLDIAPNLIRDYVQRLKTCDLVIASKRHPLSRVKAPHSRIILSRSFNILVRSLTGIDIKDTQAGMKAGKGDVMRKIFEIMLVKRYAFDVELLTIALILNLKVVDMPVEMHIERRFKLREAIRMFVDVLSVSYRSRIAKFYQSRLLLGSVE